MPTATPVRTPVPAAPRPPPAPRLDAFSSKLLSATNQARASQGLPALALNAPLTRAAQDYAALMAQYDWLSHSGPDGSTMSSRVKAAGYGGGWLGEVLYLGPIGDSPSRVVSLWMGSPTHREVLLLPQFEDIGVGCAVSGDRRWCVEDFGGPP